MNINLFYITKTFPQNGGTFFWGKCISNNNWTYIYTCPYCPTRWFRPGYNNQIDWWPPRPMSRAMGTGYKTNCLQASQPCRNTPRNTDARSFWYIRMFGYYMSQRYAILRYKHLWSTLLRNNYHTCHRILLRTCTRSKSHIHHRYLPCGPYVYIPTDMFYTICIPSCY